jgi:hypothetical protein
MECCRLESFGLKKFVACHRIDTPQLQLRSRFEDDIKMDRKEQGGMLQSGDIRLETVA